MTTNRDTISAGRRLALTDPQRMAALEAWVTGQTGTERERLQRLADFSPFRAAREWARQRLAHLDCQREDV